MPRTTQMLLQTEHYIDILILTLPQLLWSPQAVHLQILRRISGSTRSRLYAANHSQILRHNACGAEGQSRRRHERKHQIQENECVNHEGVGHRTPPPPRANKSTQWLMRYCQLNICGYQKGKENTDSSRLCADNVKTT